MHLKPYYFSLSFLRRAIRSILISRKVTESIHHVPIRIDNPFIKLKITVAPTAHFVCNGILRATAWQGGEEPVSITLAEDSLLGIDGEFVIGNGTRISPDKGASLFIGGKNMKACPELQKIAGY